MDRPTLSERLRYAFDGWMSRGAVALIGLLGLATVALVVVVGTLAWILHAYPEGSDGDLFDLWWGGLMRTLDPGTMGGDTGWGFRFLMLVITIGGLIIVASLIGIISGAFDDRIALLRKGHSRVLEHDHTLILGWNNKVPAIVRELVVANASRRRAVVVVLADRDKLAMEDELRARCGDLDTTVVICRSGDPKVRVDLALGSPQWARSIILLAPDEAPDPDADVIKTALALANDESIEGRHIVAELCDPANAVAAHLVGRDKVHWVLGPEVIGRIAVQSCRQPGMSMVWQELLDFAGDEFYFTSQPDLAGRTYFEAQLAFETCTVAGIVMGGVPVLNPPADIVVGEDDQLIVIAPDDSEIEVGRPPSRIDETHIVAAAQYASEPERVLVLGTNAVLPVLVGELDAYVAPGSVVVLVAPGEPSELPGLAHLIPTFVAGETTRRAVLDRLDVGSFDHVILLADPASGDAEQVDSRTLVTLLHLRDIAERQDLRLSIVSEMLNDSNRELAEVARVDDLIVSDRMVALLLAQISENSGLDAVFGTLFAAEGCEVYLRPACRYVAEGAEVDFYTVLEAARRREETAIGYRSAGPDGGVRLNPDKRGRVRFGPGDQLIVIAEE